MTSCPSSEQLRQLLADRLAGPEDVAVEAHVETCAGCQEILEQLTRSPNAWMGWAPTSGGRSDGDFLRRLEQHPQARSRPPHDPTGGTGLVPHTPTPPPALGPTHDYLGARTIPPDQPDPPARAGGPRPQMAAEIRALLHQRLRLVGLLFLIGWGLTWTHKFFRLPMAPDTVWLVMVPGGVLLAFCVVMVAALWAPRSRSPRWLRGYELVCYAVPMTFLLWENYFTIFRPGAAGGWMHRYVQRDLSEAITLARHSSIVWCVMVVAYGIFIPNTLRRCAAVTGSLAGAVLGMNLVCGLWDEAIPRRYLFSYLAEMTTWLAIAVGFSVYGSHKISVLRQQAFEARRLGQYRIQRRLGAGGMGEVYLAEHVLLRRPCALKLIRPERAGDPTNLARFEREVQATAALTHPNVVEIYDYGRADDGTFYYAMEYLPGLTLHELVGRHGPLPPERAVHLLRQVCGALQEAHAAGLIHRDVKPGNILVCRRGGQHEVAKLLDFGLVRAHGPTGPGEKLTRDGAVAGTPAYMSPEQVAGGEDADARGDLYSLGAVAYYLLTGRPPFVRDSVVRTLAAHLDEPVVAPDRHRPDVPGDLQAAVLRCLEKNPAGRFRDADEFARALSRCRCADRWTWEQAAAWWRDHAAGGQQEACAGAGSRA
jgi:serine/threonine-protein kinase